MKATGEPASDFLEAERLGITKCDLPDGCESPLPDLDSYSSRALEMFLELSASIGMGNGFGMAHMNRNELQAECEIRQIELSEHLLEKFKVCERATRDAEAKEKS